jgi:hypothetical protein
MLKAVEDFPPMSFRRNAAYGLPVRKDGRSEAR